jgi:hypothetical protein
MCEKEFGSARGLTVHKFRQHKIQKFLCSVCGQLFRRFNKATAHMARVHPKHPDQVFIRGEQTRCPWCNEKLSLKAQKDRFPFVKHHILECQKNPRILAIKRDPNYLTSNDYICDQCQAQFSHSKNLKLHKKRFHPLPADDTDWMNMEREDEDFENYRLDDQDIDDLLDERIDPKRLYNIVSQSTGHNFKFDASSKNMQFKLTMLAKKLCSEGYQMDVLETVLGDLVEDLDDAEMEDLIYVAIDSPRVLDFPVARRFNTLSNFSVQGVMEEIRRLLQSKEKLGCVGSLSIDVKHIRARVKGSGFKPQKSTFRNKQVQTMMEWMGRKMGCVDPYKFTKNDPELSNSCFVLCLALAVSCTGKASEIVFSNKWWFRKEKLPVNIKTRTQKMYAQARMKENSPISSFHFELFQKVLERFYNRQLIVYEMTGPSNKQLQVLYSGKPERPPKERICLLYYGGHFWLINRISLIAGRGRKLCTKCGHIIVNVRRHLCQKKCLLCDDQECFKSTRTKNRGKVFLNAYCIACNRFFHSQHCLEMHRTNEVCERFARCHICLKVVRRENLDDPEDHQCSQKKCKHCNVFYSVFEEHHCFISPPKTNLEEPENQKYFALDFETTVDSFGIHTPNFVTIFQMCSRCIMNFDSETPVNCCGQRKTEMFAVNVVQRTVDFLFFDSEKRGAIVLAHYSSKFDTHFILKELTSRGIPPQVICRGNQIIQLHSQNEVKLKDSYLFFHVALNKLPKMFSLKTVKGFFPHSFNLPKNYDYSGCIPDMKYFEPDTMKPDRRKEFQEWYETRSKREWNFRTELGLYGWADTLLLAQACAVFRRDMKTMTGICPFFSSMTIAQYSTIVMRKKYMDFEKYPIMMIGDNETVAFQREQASQLAIKYLAWESHVNKRKIVSAGNANREVRIGGWRVDGKCGNTIWEVNGCFWY